MRFTVPLIIFAALLITSISCRNSDFKDINQGEIHYSITYGGPPGLIPRELMPKSLIVSFKKNKILFDINSPIGNSGISNLANHETRVYDTYVNMIGGRYYYQGGTDEVPPGLESMEGMVVKRTGRSGEIMGFKCEHAEVILPSMPDSVFHIWYTNDIDIKNPNAATPFKEVDGVLLRFFFFMGEREFVFEAESIYKKEIPEKTFQRREKYKQVPKEVIDEYIIRLVNL